MRQVWLVARREVVERARERSFLISTAVSIVIIALVTVVPRALGLGDDKEYEVAAVSAADSAVVRAATVTDEAFNIKVDERRIARADVSRALADGDVDAVVEGGTLRAQQEPDEELVNALQAATREVRSAAALGRAGVGPAAAREVLRPPPLTVRTVEPPDPERDRKGTLAFLAVLILYGQLIGYGYLVAAGVVEEKASRVVEVLLATMRPRELLAGKIVGLGLLGLGQLLLIAAAGLGVAAGTGAIEIDGDIAAAAGLALAWFVLGYAFYAGAFACAGAIVPRQEELQSSITPLSMLLLVSLLLTFGAADDPDGTLAHVASFLPSSAAMAMPPRIALGEVGVLEVIASAGITALAALALLPLAGRVYAGAVLRTGGTVKLRDAWRSAARRA